MYMYIYVLTLNLSLYIYINTNYSFSNKLKTTGTIRQNVKPIQHNLRKIDVAAQLDGLLFRFRAGCTACVAHTSWSSLKSAPFAAYTTPSRRITVMSSNCQLYTDVFHPFSLLWWAPRSSQFFFKRVIYLHGVNCMYISVFKYCCYKEC